MSYKLQLRDIKTSDGKTYKMFYFNHKAIDSVDLINIEILKAEKGFDVDVKILEQSYDISKTKALNDRKTKLIEFHTGLCHLIFIYMNFVLYEKEPTISAPDGVGKDAVKSYIKLEKAYDLCVNPIYDAVKPIIDQAIEMAIPASLAKLKVGHDFEAQMATKINKANLVKSVLDGKK